MFLKGNGTASEVIEFSNVRIYCKENSRFWVMQAKEIRIRLENFKKGPKTR